MDHPQPAPASWTGAVASLAGLGASLGLAWLAFSRQLPAPPVTQPARETATEVLGAAPVLQPCVMAEDGYWRGRIVGAGSLDVDWRGAELECAGNARPGNRGLRLFFAGRPAGGDDRLMLIIGIAAGLDELAGREHAASVTLIDESSSQFFRSRDGSCYTRVHAATPLAGGNSFRVAGDLYCAGAIAAVSGPGSVTIGDTAFAGRLAPGAD